MDPPCPRCVVSTLTNVLTFAFEEINAIRDQALEARGEEAGGLLGARGDDVVLTLQASNCASDPLA